MEKDSIWIKTVVFVGVRVIWYIGLMFVAIFGLGRYYYGHWIDIFDKTYFLAICIGCIPLAVFLPFIFERERLRGRGTLEETRRKSSKKKKT